METFRRWWNGKYGGLARRDLYIWTDGGRFWEVEARRGGDDTTSRRQRVGGEREALEVAAAWRARRPGDQWKDITDLGRRRDRRGDELWPDD